MLAGADLHRRTANVLLLAAAALWPAVGLQAEPPATQPLPASRPASREALEPPLTPVDPAVEKILDRLERKGNQIEDIQAQIEYVKTDRVLEDKQKCTGILLFKQDKPNPRFLIRFDKFEQEGVVRDKKEWHAFDGQWYTEARERTRTIVKRQIVRPGEQIEVFRLGQGPFPLPFGQKKGEIRGHFTVKLLPPAPGDPPNADHLECTPIPGTDMARKYGTVHFYIDRSLDLPVRVCTIYKEEDTEVAASFRNIKVNGGLPGSATNVPDLPDYSIETVPLTSPAPEAGSARSGSG